MAKHDDMPRHDDPTELDKVPGFTHEIVLVD